MARLDQIRWERKTRSGHVIAVTVPDDRQFQDEKGQVNQVQAVLCMTEAADFLEQLAQQIRKTADQIATDRPTRIWMP